LTPYIFFDWQANRELDRVSDLPFAISTISITTDNRFAVLCGSIDPEQGAKRFEGVTIDAKGTIDRRCLGVWDRKEKKLRTIANFGREI